MGCVVGVRKEGAPRLTRRDAARPIVGARSHHRQCGGTRATSAHPLRQRVARVRAVAATLAQRAGSRVLAVDLQVQRARPPAARQAAAAASKGSRSAAQKSRIRARSEPSSEGLPSWNSACAPSSIVSRSGSPAPTARFAERATDCRHRLGPVNPSRRPRAPRPPAPASAALRPACPPCSASPPSCHMRPGCCLATPRSARGIPVSRVARRRAHAAGRDPVPAVRNSLTDSRRKPDYIAGLARRRRQGDSRARPARHRRSPVREPVFTGASRARSHEPSSTSHRPPPA